MANEPLDKDVFNEFKERVVVQLDELTKESKSINSKVDNLNSTVNEIKISMEKFAHKEDLKKIEDALYKLARKEEIEKIQEQMQTFATHDDLKNCQKDTKDTRRFALTNWVIILAAAVAAAAAIWAAVLK